MTNWIKCSDRLPDLEKTFEDDTGWSSDDVLVRTGKGKIRVRYYTEDRDGNGVPSMRLWMDPDSNDQAEPDITHWQPLPEAPNED